MSSPETSADPRRTFWWVLFALGTIAILAFVPVAFPLQKLLRERVGEEGLRWGMAGLVAAAAVAVAVFMARRRRELSPAFVARALVVPAVTVAWMVQQGVVAEAFHLVEYGLLGAVAFRALSCHLRDASVYLAAAVLTALVGTCEEFVQWLTPGRVWGLRDVGLNAAGAVLVQAWIAVLRPPGIAWRPTRRSLRLAARLGAFSALLGLILLLLPAFAG